MFVFMHVCVQSSGVNPILCASPLVLSNMEKIRVSPQAKCVRLLIVEQGMNLRI